MLEKAGYGIAQMGVVELGVGFMLVVSNPDYVGADND
jgi:hypothetical protein